MKKSKKFIIHIAIILCIIFISTKVEANSNTNEMIYTSNFQTVAKQIRDNTVKRNEIFAVNVKLILDNLANDKIFDKYADKFVNMGMSEEIANSSSAGDYLKYSWDQYMNSNDAFYVYQNNKYTYYLTITYYFEYYTTYNQEKKLDNKISNYIKQNIDKTKDSDFTKISKIYNYITENICYDAKNKRNDLENLKYTAYGAITNKKALCQGYSTLLYKMLKESGINDVKIVRSSTHAWNIVKIGNLYYNLDSTWDAKKKDYKYFLKGTNTFNNLKNHKLVEEYSIEEFKKNYPMSKKDYSINKDKIKISKLKAISKAKIKITWNRSSNCDGYIIEYSTNNKMKNAKTIKIASKKINNKTIGNLKRKKKYYVRIRSYKIIYGKKYYSKWSSIKNIVTKR